LIGTDGGDAFALMTTFPRKTYTMSDAGATLKVVHFLLSAGQLDFDGFANRFIELQCLIIASFFNAQDIGLVPSGVLIVTRP
jgi:hypothetical protein